MENWSTRTLDKKIQSMLFERTALSRKPDILIAKELKILKEEDKLTPDLVFRDPYILDFLGLKNTYAKKDLEAAILREMEGSGIRVAAYWTESLPKAELERKLHAAGCLNTGLRKIMMCPISAIESISGKRTNFL
jgi:hypothetical protein